MSNIIIFKDGELDLQVSLDEETVWLNRHQLSELFCRDIKTIGKHINNVFKENELEKNSTVANFATIQNEGGREVTREIEHYNLDVIISVGYRVKSQRGVKFRQWATKILKRYIQDGYVINTHKITEQRLSSIENDLEDIKSHIKNNTLELKQGIFYDGEIFDAYVFLSDLIKSATISIVVVDNYIDESTFTLLSKNQDISITIYTATIPKQLKLDIEKYNKQYNNLNVKIAKNYHDRFIIIDGKEIYHIGASLKDLGKKVFAFSKINLDANELLENIS
jgi:hypothetical protein